MQRHRLTCLLSLCAVALLAALPGWSGLTDFSPGLIEAMQKRFGAEAPRRLQPAVTEPARRHIGDTRVRVARSPVVFVDAAFGKLQPE